eukprot:TRINITY_DN17392_c0_g2_i1.p1 TRINITY_DN17392_c0_g2~~TRINITY_DN17392_c0_g2_i1.p1  ORF type:complete len:251 (-),score=33.36 TRINITY_DN17392_c0_g2_i1:685-1437(-)
MSLSPVVGVKRRPSEDEQATFLYKRSRILSQDVGFTECQGPQRGQTTQYKNVSSELQVLTVLFPGMDQQKVKEAYERADQDVQAAIRLLNQLNLQENQDQLQDHQEQEQEQDENEEGRGVGQSKLSEELVDSGMQQLQAATSYDDGKQKLAQILHHLETVKEQQFKQVINELKESIREKKQQNGILKRAVQIQNSRMQEIIQREVILRQENADNQQKIRELEVKNFSLAMHLETAIKNQGQNGFQPPDIF